MKIMSESESPEITLRVADTIIGSMSEGVVVTDDRECILAVNPAFTAITGYAPEDVVGKTPRILKSGRHTVEFYKNLWEALTTVGRWEGEIWNRRKNGEVHPTYLTISAIRDGKGALSNYVGVMTGHLAPYDPLTRLPTRELFRDRLGQALAQARRAGQCVAVVFIDLDRFHAINESLGPDSGDHVLQTAAERLTGCVRQVDTVARPGGDEFAVVLVGLTHKLDTAIGARKILHVLSQPYTLGGADIFLTASIGIAVHPSDGETAESLITNADAAAYQAKERGGNRCEFFSTEMGAEALDRLALTTELRRSLERGEFLVHYQPQLDLRSGRVVGVEALVRWRHPDAGPISPAQFVPQAEASGLIVPIGEWVLRTACAQNKVWQACGFPSLRVAVNLSARQFRQPDLLGSIQRVLQETGLDPRSLELELTESIIMHNAEAALAALHALNTMGVQLSIDDFGTGYSSLSYLKRFPIQVLKIDQSFVRGLAVDPSDAAIVTAIIALAHSLDLRVIAEGVETEEQLTFLRSHQCDEMQGYYFSRPLPVEEVTQLLREGRRLDVGGAHA